MSLYTNEAIKVCPPEETVDRCLKIIKKYELEENEIIHYEFRNQKEFGIWAANMTINHKEIYESFPDDFPYLKDAKLFWFKKVSGKGLSRTQCTASLYMEFFERLSIEFKTYDIADKRKILKYRDYLESIKSDFDYLYTYLKRALATKDQDEESSFITCKDIVTGKEMSFPIKLLFQSSNGYTAGNETKEALVHGIFEIVERYTQTLFIIKMLDATKDDIAKRSVKQLYSYDENLIDNLKDFDPFVVSISSIIKEFPDLEKPINLIKQNFTKFEIVDVSLVINGVKFYSYIVRQGVEKTNFKLFASGGCHFDQRIAILRALTEASQGYVSGEKLNQSWNGYLFTRNFIDKVFNANLEERPILKDARSFSSMDEIYGECVKPFGSIVTLDCTVDKFQIPVYAIYIPELYSKSFLWSNIFCTAQVGDVDLIKTLGENKLESIYNFLTEKSITGVETLFFIENYNQLLEEIREKVYYLYLSYTNDKELFKFVIDNEENIEKKERLQKLFDNQLEPEITTIPSLDKDDNDSFIYFNNILTKNDKSEDDFIYLVESYCKMGVAHYAQYFAEKNDLDISDILEDYLLQYIEILDYTKFTNMYGRSGDLSKIFYGITRDENYSDESKEFYNEESQLKKRYNSMFEEKDGKKRFFGISVGDSITEWKLDTVYQIGEYLYKFSFINDKKRVMSLTLSLAKNDKFKLVTDNGYYLDYTVGAFEKDRKKVVSEFVSIIEKV